MLASNISSLWNTDLSSMYSLISINTSKLTDFYKSDNLFDAVKKQYGSNTADTTSYDLAAYETKTLGERLGSALSSLSALNSGGAKINKKVTSSTNSQAVTADASNMYGTPASSYEMKVDRIATAQTNGAAAMKSAERSAETGIYKFQVEVGSKKQTFSVGVTDADDNNSIQKKIANAINSAKLGVTASVTSENGTSTLSVTGGKTGEKQTFSITDLDENGLASQTGINSVSTEGQDAQYSVNGREYTSATNVVGIGNGIKATLKDVTSGATLTVGRDAESSRDAVESLVGTVNSILDETSIGDGKGTAKLYVDVARLNTSFASSLGRIGIGVSSDGSLSINDKKLNNAINNGDVDGLFRDSLGYSKKLSKIASDMQSGTAYSNTAVSTTTYNKNMLLQTMMSSGMFYNTSSSGSLFDALF